MKILFTGGGSGGHIIPIISIAREMKKLYTGKNLKFYFIGPKDEIDPALFLEENIKIKIISTGKIRRYVTPGSLKDNFIDIFFRIPLGVIQSFSYIYFLSPDLIFSKGGFGSIPPVLAGGLLFVPIFLHESDITPGAANKLLRGFALEIFTSFPKTEAFSLKKLIRVGNPIRKNILNGSKEKAREIFKIRSRKPVILIMGGSQGAQRINDKILEVLEDLLKNFEVIHQCGEMNYKTIKQEFEAIIKNRELRSSYHLYPYLKENQLREAYALTDIIISRAGSGSIFEIAAVGKPSILVPLPESAQNHQIKNAYAYEERGACYVMEENNFTSHFFLERLKYLFENPQKLETMSQRAKDFSKPRAASVIANYLVEFLTK